MEYELECLPPMRGGTRRENRICMFGPALVANLKACGNRKDLQGGKRLHANAVEAGCHKSVYVATALINMYKKCGSMQNAHDVFRSMVRHDVVSWTALILGYVENGESLMALDLFNSMDCAPDRVTFVAALKACASLAMEKRFDKKACLQKGMSVHRQARERGFDKHVFLANTLVDMYSKCGNMVCARGVFDTMLQRAAVSWNVIILGYVENGESLVALNMFDRMDCAPDAFTFVAALKACANLATDSDKAAWLKKGTDTHRRARERGFERDVFVASTLVDMYRKCGDMQQAREVFDRMTHRTAVSWTALILGYVENGESSVALDVFNRMDCAPDLVTFVAALKACASLGALEAGQRIHDRVRELGLEQDETVASCLVDFYGKCGNMAAAEDVFNRMRCKDIVSWTALIGGYSLLGDTSRVFSLVERMQEVNMKMDSLTMLLILTACSHAGEVEQGERYFESMSVYGVTPAMEHYTCMVGMLGRGNRLQEALSLVRSMPFEGSSSVWMTLLGACKKWTNVEIGEVAFRELVTRNEKEHVAAAHVLMRNIYERLGIGIGAERKKVRAGQTWWCNAEGRISAPVVGDNMEREVIEKLKALVCGV